MEKGLSRCTVNYIEDLAQVVGGSPTVMNPVIGCEAYGPGCSWCWAASLLDRFGRHPGLTRRTKNGPVFTGQLEIDTARMDRVPGWQKLRVVFLNDLGDLFHAGVQLEALAKIFSVIVGSPHLWVIPTHRLAEALPRLEQLPAALRQLGALGDHAWPPRNVILLSSQENGREAAKKLPAGQALHDMGWQIGVSYEPAMGPGGVDGWDFARWVILGSMSGSPTAPLSAEEFQSVARSVRDWCNQRDVPFYLKQGPSPLTKRMVVHNPLLDGIEHRGLWTRSQ